MRRALWLALAIRAFAQPAPDCTYTLAHSRPGALAVFRNEKLLQPADYTRSGTLGRTVTLNGWTDGDKITFMYPFAASTAIPGTNPPSSILIWISTIEYKACTGTQNPPEEKYVPYTGATRDLDLGNNFSLRAKEIKLYQSGNGSRGYITAGPAPASTQGDDGKVYDAVLFLDQADKKMKILKQDSTVVSLE